MARNINTQDFLKKTPGERFKALIASSQLAVIVAAVAVMIITIMLYSFSTGITDTARNVSLLCVRTYASEIAQFSAFLLGQIRDAEGRIDAIKQEAARPNTTKEDVVNKLEGVRAPLNEMSDQIHKFVDYTRYQPPDKASLLISSAYAAEQTPIAVDKVTLPEKAIPLEAKKYVLGLVLLVLSSAFIVSIVSIFRTKDAEVLRFAFDTVKTLLGFFIGVATTLLGT